MEALDETLPILGGFADDLRFRAGVEILASAPRRQAAHRRVQELIDQGVGQPFAPAGKVFKEWVSVPTRDRRRWRDLLREGVAFVAPS